MLYGCADVDCGNEIKVNTRHLMRGTAKGLWMYSENSAKRGPVAEDLTNRRFETGSKNWKVKTGPGGNAAA